MLLNPPQIFDKIFGQVFGQGFDQVFGQGFDQGFGEGKNHKYSVQYYPDPGKHIWKHKKRQHASKDGGVLTLRSNH